MLSTFFIQTEAKLNAQWLGFADQTHAVKKIMKHHKLFVDLNFWFQNKEISKTEAKFNAQWLAFADQSRAVR